MKAIISITQTFGTLAGNLRDVLSTLTEFSAGFLFQTLTA